VEGEGIHIASRSCPIARHRHTRRSQGMELYESPRLKNYNRWECKHQGRALACCCRPDGMVC